MIILLDYWSDYLRLAVVKFIGAHMKSEKNLEDATDMDVELMERYRFYQAKLGTLKYDLADYLPLDAKYGELQEEINHLERQMEIVRAAILCG